jgi:hypothetical protein
MPVDDAQITKKEIPSFLGMFIDVNMEIALRGKLGPWPDQFPRDTDRTGP